MHKYTHNYPNYKGNCYIYEDSLFLQGYGTVGFDNRGRRTAWEGDFQACGGCVGTGCQIRVHGSEGGGWRAGPGHCGRGCGRGLSQEGEDQRRGELCGIYGCGEGRVQSGNCRSAQPRGGGRDSRGGQRGRGDIDPDLYRLCVQRGFLRAVQRDGRDRTDRSVRDYETGRGKGCHRFGMQIHYHKDGLAIFALREEFRQDNAEAHFGEEGTESSERPGGDTYLCR